MKVQQRISSSTLICFMVFAANGMATSALGQSISMVPTRSALGGSPAATWGDPINAVFNPNAGPAGCWEYELASGGVQLQLNINAEGWGQAPGSPTLGAIQATVMATAADGYISTVPAGGHLVPFGWPGGGDPDTRRDGAYTPRTYCSPDFSGDGRPCGGNTPFASDCSVGGGFCVHNPDYIMPAANDDLFAVVTLTIDYVWATVASVGSVTDPGSVKTLGTLVLEVPADAAGTYVIAFIDNPNFSFLSDGLGAAIPDVELIPACIVFPGSCCLPDRSCTALLPSDCFNAGGVPVVGCRGDLDPMNGDDDTCEADCDGDGILDIDELASCPDGDPSCDDCNLNGTPDECDIDSGFSQDTDGDGVPNECDNCPDVSNPGQEDQNGDDLGDACSGACCDEDTGFFLCLHVDSEENCTLETGGSGVFQGVGTVCPTEGVSPAFHFGVVVTHVTDPAQLCGGGGGRADCIPGDPIDPWQTALDADICHQFGVGPESPAIPADFFGPGSDPFTGQVCLKGKPLGPTPFGDFGEADTLVRRTGGPAGTGDPFDRCGAPASFPTDPEDVDAEVVALSLESVAPIIVTFNGGQNPESWDVMVDLSEVTPPPGTITAVKTHCNGGTYSSELHVQPRFTFTEVDDPNNIEVLDTGLAGIPFVTLTQDTNPPWTSDVSETLGLPSPICTDFHPGIEDTEPTTDCDCQPNGQRDLCDIEDGTSTDCDGGNGNGVPDECEFDCNNNGIADSCDIARGNSRDVNDNSVPDECENSVACCLSDNTCQILDSVSCAAQGGTSQGPGSTCAGNPCLRTGACCNGATGVCTNGLTQTECESASRRYGGDGSTCATIDPQCAPPGPGRCCLPDGSCAITTQSECDSQEGGFDGAGTSCEGDSDGNGIDDACEGVPAASAWGMMILVLALLAGIAIKFGFRRRPLC